MKLKALLQNSTLTEEIDLTMKLHFFTSVLFG